MQDVYVSLVEVYLTVKLNLLFLTEMYVLSSMIRLLCVIKASNSKKQEEDSEKSSFPKVSTLQQDTDLAGGGMAVPILRRIPRTFCFQQQHAREAHLHCQGKSF